MTPILAFKTFIFLSLLIFVLYLVKTFVATLNYTDDDVDDPIIEQKNDPLKHKELKERRLQYMERVRGFRVVDHFMPFGSFKDEPLYQFIIVKHVDGKLWGYSFVGIFDTDKPYFKIPEDDELYLKSGLIYKRTSLSS